MSISQQSQTDHMEIPDEFGDVVKVLEEGALKYGTNSWLLGKHFNHKDNHASIFRHIAESSTGITQDVETGLHPLLHAACRCLMEYTLVSRGLDVKRDGKDG